MTAWAIYRETSFFTHHPYYFSDPLFLKNFSMKSGHWVGLETVLPPALGKEKRGR
jgi:hypothetical protein